MGTFTSLVPPGDAFQRIAEAQDALAASGSGVPGPAYIQAFHGAKYGEPLRDLLPDQAADLITTVTGASNHHITLLAYGLRALGLRIAPAMNVKAGIGRNLTARETEVMEQLVLGKSNKEIGRAIGLCESTVKLHAKNIMQKLGVHNRTAAALIWKGGAV